MALISTLVIRSNIEKITEVWSPSLEYLQDLETMTAKYRIKQYQHLVESDAATMNSCEEEIQKLRTMIHDCGAEDAVRKLSEDFSGKALAILERFPKNQYRDLLKDLTLMLIGRNI